MRKFLLLLVLLCLVFVACVAAVPATAQDQQPSWERCGTQIMARECPYLYRLFLPVVEQP